MDATIALNINEIKSHLTTNKFIFPTAQSYESESKGFHTYGPLGVELKNKIINLWRQLFVTFDVFEIDTPLLQSKEVLTNSGHVGKFNDLIISNGKEIYRADHLVKDFCEKNNINLNKPIDNFDKDELLELVKFHKMVENSENATISPKNLMFNCGEMYLRPEIAQGMFTEFEQFYGVGGKNLPFGLAQVGKSYRNEISPQPFIRLREFTQAEVEYFFDPNLQTHPLFSSISECCLPLLTEKFQLLNENTVKIINVKNAVDEGIIVNEIMGYFLTIVYNFVKKLGIPDSSIRFRQHLSNELAHYAVQCWDLEIKLVNGNWLECVGLAHRGDYDLKNHNVKGQNVIKKYGTKQTKFKISLLDNKESKEITSKFYSHYKNKLFNTKNEIFDDVLYPNYKNLVKIDEVVVDIESTVFPNVIEPSMGIDRIIFAMANNLLYRRLNDTNRILFKLPLNIAPMQIAIYALSNNDDLVNYVKSKLFYLNNYFRVCWDFSSVSIGRKYSRSDSIGVGLTITVDFETIDKEKNTFDTVTLRYSLDGHQDRIHISQIIKKVNEMINDK